MREGGSDYVRDKVLRGMLASEQKLIATGKRLRASLEAKNYLFEDGGMTDTGLQRMLLKPREEIRRHPRTAACCSNPRLRTDHEAGRTPREEPVILAARRRPDL